MKQEQFFNELLLISYHLKIDNFWYNTLKEFTKLTLNDNDLNHTFYNQMYDFGYFTSLLSNQLPIFSSSFTESELKESFNKVESFHDIPFDLKFLWNNLFTYLNGLDSNLSSHSIELIEIIDFVDNALLFINTEMTS